MLPTIPKRLVLPLLAAAPLLLATGAARAGEPVRLTLRDHHFTPDKFTVPAGTRFRIAVTNRDSTVDEFESYDLKVEKIVVPGDTIHVWAGPLHPGTYKIFDDYHPSATGTVTAVAGKE